MELQYTGNNFTVSQLKYFDDIWNISTFFCEEIPLYLYSHMEKMIVLGFISLNANNKTHTYNKYTYNHI